MKKSLIFALVVGAAYSFTQIRAFAENGAGMDFGGTSAKRFERIQEILNLTGTLSCSGAVQRECDLKLTEGKSGQTYRIMNGEEAMGYLNAGRNQVALEAVAQEGNLIKVLRIRAL